MDGDPNSKSKIWRKILCSDTRWYSYKWMEKELPSITGDVINIGAGGSPIPKQLLTNPKLGRYVTFDQRLYGDSKNHVDVIGDVHNMDPKWTNRWDCVLCIQSAECFSNLDLAMEEIYRILKPNGILLLDSPFNYRFFGEGTFPGKSPKKKRVMDYYRVTRDGWEYLTRKFKKVEIKGFGGTGEHDRYIYCVKAIK